MTQKKSTAAMQEAEAYQDELRDSVKWLRLAVTKIQNLAIPASPENYAIWYEYYSGRKPELKKALDRRLNNKRPFTPEVCRQFYSEFFVEGPEQQLAEVRRAIRTLISKLSSEISDLDCGMNHYEVFLAECELELAKDAEVIDLHNLIKDLVDQTRKCRSQNNKAMEKVAKLSKEIDSLRQSLQHMSEEVLEDPLTGVGNRRGFDLELTRAMSESDKEGSQLILLLLDIDHFKRVNDEHGHLVGDRVLRFVSESIKKSVKGRDYVARYGGEEFAVILSSTAYEGGMTIARSILQNVAGTKLTVSKGGKAIGNVTLSAGLCVYQSGESAEQMIERADQCLYRAKADGRNSIASDKD